MIALLLLSLLAAPNSPPTSLPAAGGETASGKHANESRTEAVASDKTTREIALDEKNKTKIYRVRTAVAYPALVEFPEVIEGEPDCGNCGEDIGLFILSFSPGSSFFSIKPRFVPGLQRSGPLKGSILEEDDFVTPVTVRLKDSKTAITIQVELAPRERADARVVFTFPQRSAETAYVREQLAKSRSAMEAAFAKKVDQKVSESFLRSLLEPHQCVHSDARARKDSIVFEVQELCRFGARIYVQFTVENRGRTAFQVGELTVKFGRGKSAVMVDEVEKLLTVDRLEFNETGRGVIGFSVEGLAENLKMFDLTLVEGGGRGREIVASDLTF